jgi:serine/threonine protein kinase
MGTEVKLRTELDRVKVANVNLNKYLESEMKDYEEHKEILLIRNQELQVALEATKTNLQLELEQLKIANENINKCWEKDREERSEMQNNLQKELEKLTVLNNIVQKKYEAVLSSEMSLRTEVVRLKTANDNLHEYWESHMKNCEEEKNILIIHNQELQKELQAMKTNVPVQNWQLDGGNCQPQQGRQCGTDTADDGKMSLHNFQFIRTLGEGGFGRVVLAKGKLPGVPEELYAIKAIKKRGITSSNICMIMAERKALMLTSGHPFITTLYSCFQNKEHIFFVMEYMSGGDLRDQLDKVEFFSEKTATFYAAEITVAVQFLHQHGILHRDLKLENVLVDSDGHCKIADFGLSKLRLFRHCKTSTQCGTPYCMAPEILKNLPYGQGVDWWAVGVMLFQMMTGYPPFYSDEEEDTDDDYAEDSLYQKIVNDEVDFPKHMSLAARSIVKELLTKDPALRLGSNGSVNTLRQHPFFKGIDWKALEEKRVKPPEKEKVVRKPEEDTQSFSNVLAVDNTPGIINQHLFQGFSFMNYGAK